MSYRRVIHSFFAEIERAQKLGISLDLAWDLPGLEPKGYREVMRIREDGKVEVMSVGMARVLQGPREPARPAGFPPGLTVSVEARESSDFVAVTAIARIVERSAPVYYTHGADVGGVYHNAMAAWELYGPGEEDYLFPTPEGLKPVVRRTEGGAEVEMRFRIEKPGRYRLRVSTVDEAGRSSVVWKDLGVIEDAPSKTMRLNEITGKARE
ncbi:MAG: hypothetical protein ACP5U2_13165 [Bryobacteraceae bacterium]